MMFRRARSLTSVTLPLLCAAFVSVTVLASDIPTKPAISPPISSKTRMELVRAFNSELVYIRTPFPMGKTGLKLKSGTLSPAGDELQQMIAMWGPSVKPVDQARISNITIKDKLIHFEINGGPVRNSKWYERISVSGMGGATPVTPDNSNANARGSFVDLAFDKYVPEMDPRQLKEYLRPVFDFDSKSPLDAYLETVPPKVKKAIQEHRVLVGMNREMVIYAKGRPPKKVREKDGDVEHEDWIYGEPPQDVDFVRMIGDEVVRVETMKVSGEKEIRTAKEVDLNPNLNMAQANQVPAHPANAPTLRRPGEDLPDGRRSTDDPINPAPLPPDTTQPDSAPPTPGGPGHWGALMASSSLTQ